jgi:hypothetical protein
MANAIAYALNTHYILVMAGDDAGQNSKGRQMKLSEAPTADILREIKKFQNAQKRYPATSEIHADIGKQLAPLFAEMARRTAKKAG